MNWIMFLISHTREVQAAWDYLLTMIECSSFLTC